MAIKHLDHPERDLTLQDRESGTDGAADGLELLRARIAEAKHPETIEREKKRAVPVSRCTCFDRGWMAALAVIEDGGVP